MSSSVLTLDKEGLVEMEVEALKEFYFQHSTALHPLWPHKEYVSKVADLQEPLIRAMGGWRWKSPYAMDPVGLSHSVLREVVGGVERSHLCELPLLPFDDSGLPFCRTFQCHLPKPHLDDWARFAIARETFSVSIGGDPFMIRKGQRVSRSVLNHVRRCFASYPQYVRMWEALFADLGERWSADKGFRFTISVAPSDWFKLGTLGETSCYRVGGEQEFSKINLSLAPGAFVAFAYRGDSDEVIGRCWGKWEGDRVMLTNAYLYALPSLLPSLTHALGQLFEREYVGTSPISVIAPAIYVNSDSTVISTEVTVHPPDVRVRSIERHDSTITMCPYSCGRRYGHGDAVPQCAHCRRRHCMECSEECPGEAALATCSRCSTMTAPSTATTCAISEQTVCESCALMVMRTCNRCEGRVSIRHVTRCGTCGERRCDNCRNSDESTTVDSLCAGCSPSRGQGDEYDDYGEPNPCRCAFCRGN